MYLRQILIDVMGYPHHVMCSPLQLTKLLFGLNYVKGINYIHNVEQVSLRELIRNLKSIVSTVDKPIRVC